MAAAINLEELEERAREVLPQMAYDYYASGADDEVTRATKPVSMPILIAPTALAGLADPEGEVATTKAAGAVGTMMTLATISTSSIEEAMAVATGPVWFQLYVFKDRAISVKIGPSAPRW